MRSLKTTLIIILLAFLPTTHAFVTVGLGPDCDYNNLFPAYNDSDTEIRVTSEQTHTNNFTIEKIKIIKGGYDTCLTAEANIPGNVKSRWSGLNALNRTTVVIDTNLIILSTVIIENFEIYDGNNTSISGAGGIRVSGNSNLLLRNSVIYDNVGTFGAGIHVTGNEARLSLENTVVRNNQASYGGGIFCTLGAYLSLDANSSIYSNVATFNGGGIFAHGNCQIINSSGLDHSQQEPSGIYANEAELGGGIYLQGGSDLNNIGTVSYPALISTNVSNNNNGPGGGGLYLTGQGTSATLVNSAVINNEANSQGGGMMVINEATLTIHQDENGCEYNQPCSFISANELATLTGEGAAGYFSGQATVEIAQSVISLNRSNEVGTFVINNGAYLRLEGNLIHENTGVNQSFSTSLFKITGEANQGSQLDFIHNTVVDNDPNHIFTADNLNSMQTLNVFNSIIWDSGNVYNFNGPSLAQIDCSVVHENLSLSGNIGALLANNPLFVNPNSDDFRLSFGSDAIDFCDNNTFPVQYKDLNNNIRGNDITSINNAFGPYDAGAYEYTINLIFRNGFE